MVCSFTAVYVHHILHYWAKKHNWARVLVVKARLNGFAVIEVVGSIPVSTLTFFKRDAKLYRLRTMEVGFSWEPINMVIHLKLSQRTIGISGIGFTTLRHCTMHKYPCLLLEVNQ
jgi:hypothetical protein